MDTHVKSLTSRLFIFGSMLIASLSAWAVPASFTFQSKIFKPDGSALESAAVNFRFTTLDPTGTCILYVEDFINQNMQSSAGLVIFNLGSGAKVFPVAPFLYPTVFDNLQSSLGCQGGGAYSPAVARTDSRKIVLQFNDASGLGWQILPAVNITSVPFANYAGDTQKFAGFDVTQFLRTSALPNCSSGGTVLTSDGATISCVASGGSGGSGTVTTVTGTAPISVATGTSTPAISISTANATTTGAISSTDWNIFNNKLTASLADTKIFIGNGSNLAMPVSISGDATIANSGAITLNTVSATKGGTGQSVYVIGDLLYASSTSALSRLPAATNGFVLTSNGAGNAPAWQVSASSLPAASGTAAAPGYAFVGNTNTGMFGALADQIGFATAGSERIRINALGNVGIGTASPGQKLSVAGVIESSSGGIKFPDGTVQTTASSGGTATGVIHYGSTSPSGVKMIQSNAAAGLTLAFATSVTAGSLLVVALQAEGSVSAITVTDTLGTSYTMATEITGNLLNMTVYYGIAPASGVNTVTGTHANSWPRMSVTEFQGLQAVVDATATVYNSTSTATANITTVTAGDLLYAAAGAYHSANTFSAGNGFTLATQANGADANAVEYKFVGAAGVYTATINILAGSPDNSTFVIVAFRPTATGAAVGSDGDFYLDTSTKILYGPRAGGIYAPIGSLN